MQQREQQHREDHREHYEQQEEQQRQQREEEALEGLHGEEGGALAEHLQGIGLESLEGLEEVHGRLAPVLDGVDDGWWEGAALVWLGPGDAVAYSNLQLRYPRLAAHHWDGTALRPATGAGRRLMRRYALVERLRDARVVGVLVGTLAVADYAAMVRHCRALLQAAGKAHYTYVVGKLSPAKLANFPDVDLFVLVACHENSALDSRDFFRPLVTPLELQIALVPGKHWTGAYSCDFAPVLREGLMADAAAQARAAEEEEDDVRMSLATGAIHHNPKAHGRRLRQARHATDGRELQHQAGQELQHRQHHQQQLLAPPAAAHLLAAHSWKGLEPRVGETPVRLATPGRSGIAKDYGSAAPPAPPQ